jgi:hypothetical protein
LLAPREQDERKADNSQMTQSIAKGEANSKATPFVQLGLFMAGLVVFFMATGVGLWQYLQPYSWHQPYATRSQSWWLHPLERNVDAGLPDVRGNIRTVAASINGKCLWIVGDSGLFAFSPDRGSTWINLDLQTNGDFRLAPGRRPCVGNDTVAQRLPSDVKIDTAISQQSPSPQPQPTPTKPTPSTGGQQLQKGDPTQGENPNAQTDNTLRTIRNASFTVTPAKIDFNFVGIGNPTTVMTSLTNTGETPVTIRINVIPSKTDGVTGDFHASASDCTNLLPKKTCVVLVEFVPKFTGGARGSIELVDLLSGVKAYIPTSGVAFETSGPGTSLLPDPTPSGNTGKNNFTVAPSSVAFNSVSQGGSSSQLVRLKNPYTSTLSIAANILRSTSGQNSDNFSVNDSNCKQLLPKSSCIVEVKFAPEAIGPGRVSIELVDAKSGMKVFIPATGMGFSNPNGVNASSEPDPTPKWYQIFLKGDSLVSQIPPPGALSTPTTSPSPTPTRSVTTNPMPTPLPPTPMPAPSILSSNSPPDFLALEFAPDGFSGKAVTPFLAYDTIDGGQVWTMSPQAPKSSPVLAAGKELKFTFSGSGNSVFLEEHAHVVLSDGQQVVGNDQNHVHALWFEGKTGWAIRGQGLSQSTFEVARTTNAGETWYSLATLTGDIPKSIVFLKNGTDGWMAGAGGVIWHTNNGGSSWLPASRAAVRQLRRLPPTIPEAPTNASYLKFPAPWYFSAALTFLFVSILALRRPKDPLPGPARDDSATIGNHPVSDRPLEPGEPDALELGKMADGLSYFLSNEKTQPPLVLAVTGRWGSGKSSLMNLLKQQLQEYGACPVWFNAWHHQKEDQLLAALLQAVKTQAVPPLLALTGIGFRWRLFLKRFRHYWPLLAFFIAGIYLVHRAESFLRTETPPLSLWSLFSYIFHLADATASASSDALSPGPVTLITGLFAAFNLLSKLLTAFGTNPASLLSTVAGQTNRKDLEAQTSFRMRFAREFRDVTESFSPSQRMLILVDDLDRCRPEKVREVLEAVNFLVSSGDCFVVLGMARDVVEEYLSLSFKRVVDSISWDALGLSEEDIARAITEVQPNASITKMWGENARKSATNSSAALEMEAKRRSYARLYLEKLVQIEVSIPEPTSAQRRALFELYDNKITEQNDQESQEAQRERQLAQIMTMLSKTKRFVVPLVQVIVLTAVLISLGLMSRDWFHSRVNEIVELQTKAQKQMREKKTDEQAEALKLIAGKLEAMAQPRPSPRPADKNPETLRGMNLIPNLIDEHNRPSGLQTSPTPAKQVSGELFSVSGSRAQPPSFRNPSISPTAGVLGTWPFYLFLAGAIGAISLVLASKPKRNLSDSKVFTDALEFWHPLVMTSGARNTPRMAKRFQNLIRYLAMRQRSSLDKPTLPLGIAMLRDWFGLPREIEKGLITLTRPLTKNQHEEIEKMRKLLDSGTPGDGDSWSVKLSNGRLNLVAKPPVSAAQNPLGERSPPFEEFKARVMGNVFVPEELLVAFAACEAYQPSLLRDEALFKSLIGVEPDSISLNAPSLAAEVATLLKNKNSTADWKRWRSEFVYFRRAYLKLCSEVTQDREKLSTLRTAAGG